MSLFVLLILLISNYYGFYAVTIVTFWYVLDYFLCSQARKQVLKRRILDFIVFLLPILLFLCILFFPALRSNLPFLGQYKNNKVSMTSTSIYRPLEDWHNFSFRPWYFFIPPKSSIFFGDLSKSWYEKIASTGYYLADDYTEEEMAGSYMGWHFLLGMVFTAALLLQKKFKHKEFLIFKSVYANKEMILRSFFIIFCILLISGPPSFTISGVEIYTPSYLLYYIVPVFRTLVRWSVVIYLFVLVINSYLVQDLYYLMKNKWQKAAFVVGFLALNFVIFAVKIQVININKPPQEIAFIKNEFPGTVPYAVYPKGDYYSIFWVISHEDLLINPVDYVNYDTRFDANKFSKNLITEKGVEDFLANKPKYLAYYSTNISEDKARKLTEINPAIKSKEDVAIFFFNHFGVPVYSQDGIFIYEVSTDQ